VFMKIKIAPERDILKIFIAGSAVGVKSVVTQNMIKQDPLNQAVKRMFPQNLIILT